ncbi:MAG: tetratricopeptide repeat protein [Candidatus Omnitrophica bacterium]|nr:tetratricopeptide repeat protein [Candidatus Omnitrophota bacterium]
MLQAPGFKLQASSLVFKPAACSLWRVAICGVLFLSAAWISSFAQEADKIAVLTKQITEAKPDTDLYPLFEELKGQYFKDNKYAEFVESLKSLGAQQKTLEVFTNYYISLARYSQLKYLEEAQEWDDYFSNGNTYRDELVAGAQKVIASTNSKDMLNIYARLILWQFHKDQQDAFFESALEDLMSATLEYSEGAKNIAPIKDIADRLISYGEKGKSKELYKIYVKKLVTSDVKEEDLAIIASDFLKEGNLELAESVYDVYIERITSLYPKEKLLPILIDIAKTFSYKNEGKNDAAYAEGIFEKLAQLGGEGVFDEGLLYLRAFNSEKAKEYNKAKDVYIDLIKQYPQTPHIDEAEFKIGIINTYVLRDIQTGRWYFEKLSQKETLSAQVISSIYQLGLLSQWQEDLVKAKEYYNKLLDKAKDSFTETVILTKERLKEIEEARTIEYNLKMFLDVSLKKEYENLDMSKSVVNSFPYRAEKEEAVKVSSTAYTGSTGCMQVEMQYLWSGHLGLSKPQLGQSSFDTNYAHSGTKEINLVVISPSGILDRNIDMVDVD